MGTFAVGDLMTTKPYVSGAAYIARMSDYCEGCTFDPATTCPIARLYWAFLARHEGRLRDNLRLRLPLQALRKRPAAKREDDARTYRQLRDVLAEGRAISPQAAEKPAPRKGRRGTN